MTTSRTMGIGRGAVLATAAALALGLLPASTASAAPLPPAAVSYLEAATLAPAAASSTGAPIAPAVTPTELAPDGYRVFGFDVSADGATLVAATCHGSIGQCTDVPTDASYDATFGVVLVHRNADTSVSSVVLSTVWGTNPVLTTDPVSKAVTAWWLANGNLYSYPVGDGLPGSTALVDATDFQPARTAGVATEIATGLAVAPDGHSAAVAFERRTGHVGGRVRAATFGHAPGVYYEQVFSGSAGTDQPSSSLFTFDSATTLLFAQTVYTAGTPGALTAWRASIPTAGTTSTPTPVPALDGFYGLRAASDGTWWLWKDSGGVTTGYTSTDVVPGMTSPVAGSPRIDGDHTYGYVPSDVAPPALSAAGASASNASSPHTSFSLSTAATVYGKKVAYMAYDLYLAPLPSYPYSTANAAEVDAGLLEYSVDKVHWSTLRTTSGAHVFTLGGKNYNGYSQVLRRNTWLRWTYRGDYLTAAAAPLVRRVLVAPVVAVKVKAAHAGKRSLYGTATRVGGTITLYRAVGHHWVKVKSVRIGAKGAYTFGSAVRPRGSYKLVLPGTSGVGWAATTKVIKL
jgi:hypothetical protein